jgi:beta-glucosidase
MVYTELTSRKVVVTLSFSKEFVWGVASAAYQIEGAWNEDGKGPSIWDEFCRMPGAVYQDQTGEISCDHYHRFKEDIAIMKQMGVKAYRFSISWPRVLPQGTGKVNEAGIVFYENIVDELLTNGITPYVTLYHWDYPAALYNCGGWMNPESPKWFEEYVTLIAKRFAGKVKHYMTFNEPQCFIGLGYCLGVHAPGLRNLQKTHFLWYIMFCLRMDRQ